LLSDEFLSIYTTVQCPPSANPENQSLWQRLWLLSLGYLAVDLGLRLLADICKRAAPAKWLLFSPKHKRTEGRAPVWGFEFTTKVATKVESAEIAAGLKRNLCDLVRGD
jgi:hypothetical protein